MTAGRYETLLAGVVDEVRIVLKNVDDAQVLALEDAIDAAPRIFCAGRGRSELAARGFAMRLMHLGLPAFVVGDTTTPAVQRGDLLLLTSGTASTATLVPVAQRADAAGARRAIVTADASGALAQGADPVVVVPAPASHDDPGHDGAPLLPMGSRFEFAAALLFEAITIRLIQRRGTTVREMFARHANLE